MMTQIIPRYTVTCTSHPNCCSLCPSRVQETLAQKQAGLKAAQDQLAEVVAKVCSAEISAAVVIVFDCRLSSCSIYPAIVHLPVLYFIYQDISNACSSQLLVPCGSCVCSVGVNLDVCVRLDGSSNDCSTSAAPCGVRIASKAATTKTRQRAGKNAHRTCRTNPTFLGPTYIDLTSDRPLRPTSGFGTRAYYYSDLERDKCGRRCQPSEKNAQHSLRMPPCCRLRRVVHLPTLHFRLISGPAARTVTVVWLMMVCDRSPNRFRPPFPI